MAESRSRKLGRLVRVQRQLERMAENELAHTLRERMIAESSQEALIGALGSLDTVHRAMAGSYAVRFSPLEGRIRQLSGVQVMQERRVLTEKTKADRLAETAARAVESEEREAADESLLDLLDSTMAGPDPSTSPA
ncbi:hypothetical protein DFR52_11417 [Hoeflea marina]|uniref:Flagellar FliJ protein n=1 Tax=Hoeflea marina TaxID=274592 RepID=A0A317PDF6_9HYPH|nr:hypothetical protein [Hoeflea marina]PWV95260.1 hypothetical protein DFR52_11417 [Hoeflea marina]